MSKRPRSRKSAAPATESCAARGGSSSAAAPATAVELPASPGHPVTNFALAAIVTAVWLLGLFGLAATTANPVTLNHHQIVRSHAVITGRVLDVSGGEVEIERVWKGGDLSGRVRVANLSETRARTGGVYILPLRTADGGDFVITSADRRRAAAEANNRRREPRGPLLIYPATAEAVEQLERILAAPEG